MHLTPQLQLSALLQKKLGNLDWLAVEASPREPRSRPFGGP